MSYYIKIEVNTTLQKGQRYFRIKKKIVPGAYVRHIYI